MNNQWARHQNSQFQLQLHTDQGDLNCIYYHGPTYSWQCKWTDVGCRSWCKFIRVFALSSLRIVHRTSLVHFDRLIIRQIMNVQDFACTQFPMINYWRVFISSISSDTLQRWQQMPIHSYANKFLFEMNFVWMKIMRRQRIDYCAFYCFFGFVGVSCSFAFTITFWCAYIVQTKAITLSLKLSYAQKCMRISLQINSNEKTQRFRARQIIPIE